MNCEYDDVSFLSNSASLMQTRFCPPKSLFEAKPAVDDRLSLNKRFADADFQRHAADPKSLGKFNDEENPSVYSPAYVQRLREISSHYIIRRSEDDCQIYY